MSRLPDENHDALRRCDTKTVLEPARYGYGRTILMDVEMIEFLLERGADVHAIDAAGQTALSFAEAKGHARVAEILRSAAGRDP